MGEIFRYTDRDGDYLRVDARHPDRLRFRAGTDDGGRSDDGAHASDVDRHNVLALHAALGAWLYPTAPGTPDTTLLEQMVRKAAEDAVTAILPLHLSGARSQSVSIDPEPHDVGHAEEPAPPCTRVRPGNAHPVSWCAFCGHLWSVHADPTPLERVREFYRSTLSPEAVVPAPKQLVGCECGHRWGVHSKSPRLGCFATGKDYEGDPLVCECTRTRESALKMECTCPGVHAPLGIHDAGCRVQP